MNGLGRFKISRLGAIKILFGARIIIGLLFIYSGISKLVQPIEYFEIAVEQYSVIPDILIHYVSLVMPWIELLFGSYLFLGYMETKAAAVLAALTGVFQIMLAQALLRRLPMDECGCFGGGFVHLTLYQSFALDTILVLLLIQLATSDGTLFAVDNWLLKNESK